MVFGSKILSVFFGMQLLGSVESRESWKNR